MEYIKTLKQGLIIAAAASLIACGGGSSSSGPVYTGKTALAKITAANAEELIGANSGSTDSADSGSANLSQTNTEPKKRRNRAISVSRVLSKSAYSASENYQDNSASSTTAAPVSADETVDGKCGGTQVTTGTEDDETFNVDLTVTFNNFCDYEDGFPEDKSTLNGVITIKGEHNEFAGSFNWKIAFVNLSYKDNTDSMSMNGSIAASGTIDSFSVEMNYDFQDHNEGKTYRAENLKVSIVNYEVDGYITGEISGKIYHPDYGSYVISTYPVLVIHDTDDYPSSGTIRIDGAEGSYAEASYHAGGTYTLTVFDGTTETIKSCDSITDVCTVIGSS